jgi:hypothetical protein
MLPGKRKGPARVLLARSRGSRPPPPPRLARRRSLFSQQASSPNKLAYAQYTRLAIALRSPLLPFYGGTSARFRGGEARAPT